MLSWEAGYALSACDACQARSLLYSTLSGVVGLQVEVGPSAKVDRALPPAWSGFFGRVPPWRVLEVRGPCALPHRPLGLHPSDGVGQDQNHGWNQ